MGRFYSKKVSNEFGNFDSTTEFEYFKILKERETKGEIAQLEMQKPFILIESFKDKNGCTIRKMEYVSDYFYVENNEIHIVDVKPSIELAEQVFKNKWKMMKWLYRDYNYHIVVKLDGKFFDMEDKKQAKEYRDIKKDKKKIRVEKKTKKRTSTKKTTKTKTTNK